MESVSKSPADASISTEEGSGGGAGQAANRSLNGEIVVDAEKVRDHLDEVVRSTMETTLNRLSCRTAFQV